MRHHPVFETFQRVPCIGTGRHLYDFLGVATKVAYKKDWEKYAPKAGGKFVPGYPAVNEHYFDWIALLQCIRSSSGTFRMAELGAGWAPWLVRAAFAARQAPAIRNLEFVGVEADPTHYAWAKDHFLDNNLDPEKYCILHGAVSSTSNILKFPKISNPQEDYGASLAGLRKNQEYVQVQGYILSDLLSGRFSGPLDFLHMDIQGAEYDVIPGAMELLKNKVKAMMVGTHSSQAKHVELISLFSQSGWEPIMIYPRNEEVVTDWGPVKFGDGFQFWKNKAQRRD